MSKRFAQFIASLFLIYSAAMLYNLLSEPGGKEPHAPLILFVFDGVIAFIAVLIFIWASQRKRISN
jgi:EamA domain-containing membrane protein RarD